MFIDSKLAIRYCCTEVLAEKIKQRFLLEYKNFLTEVAINNKKDNLSAIHKIKGISLNIGSELLYDAAVLVEENYKNIDYFIDVFAKCYKELTSS